ncbi:band 4.1-like protein 4 [Watersipora subatra]|uniref:band 4.1-like protein 4 n=1 Tax=Watersipora subatra TaxID=2589382 RepID=UPI00355BF151
MKWQEMYGVDLHPVTGAGDAEYYIGLTPSGVVIYRQKAKVNLYFWPRINDITFKGKRITLKVQDKKGNEMSYYFFFETKESCKSFWKCCIEHHAFFRLAQVELTSKVFSDLFHFGSKFRYSGRTEKELALSAPESTSQTVTRTRSQRQERRRSKATDISTSPSVPNHIAVVTPLPTQPTCAASDSLPASMTALLSASSKRQQTISEHSISQTQSSHLKSLSNSFGLEYVPEADPSWLSQRGLYTSGKDSPRSVRSEKMKFPSKMGWNDSGSEVESLYTKRRYAFVPGQLRNDERLLNVEYNRRESDNESERSGMSRRRRRRYQRGYDSASDGESVSHRRRRGNRYDMTLREGSVCSEVSTPLSDVLPSGMHRRYRLKANDEERISPGDTYEKTISSHFKSAGHKQTAAPTRLERAQKLLSCSYENILYDQSGNAHFVHGNETNHYSDYGTIAAPGRPSNKAMPPNRHSSRNTNSLTKANTDISNSSDQNTNSQDPWVKAAAVYKRMDQRPPARIVNTWQRNAVVDKTHSAKSQLSFANNDSPLVNGFSTHDKLSPPKSSPVNNSFYAEYSKRKTDSTARANTTSRSKSSGGKSPLKVSSI